MIHDKLLVQAKFQEQVSSKVWSEKESELILGYPKKWRLEKKEDGVLLQRVDSVTGKVSAEKKYTLSNQDLEQGKVLYLVEKTNNEKQPLVLEIKLSKCTSISAPYKKQNSHPIAKPDFLMFSCLGKWTLRTDKIESSLLGRVRDHVVFQVKKQGSKVKIYINSEDVILAQRGGIKKQCKHGDQFVYSSHELSDLLILKGHHSWRFHAVEVIPFDSTKNRFKKLSYYPEDSEFRKWMFTGVCTFLLLTFLGIKVDVQKTSFDAGIPPQFTKIILTPKVEEAKKALVILEKPKLPELKIEPEISREPPKVEPKPKKKIVQAVKKVKEEPMRIVGGKKLEKTNLKPAPSPRVSSAPKVVVKKDAFASKVDETLKNQNVLDALQGLAKNTIPNSGALKLDQAKNAILTKNVGDRSGQGIDLEAKSLGDSKAIRGGSLQTLGSDGNEGVAGVGKGDGYGSTLTGKGRGLASGSLDGLESFGADAGEVVMDEGLTQDEVAKVVQKNLRSLRACYSESMSRGLRSNGKVLTKFIVDLSGSVTSVMIVESNVERFLSNCISKSISTWRFPNPKGTKDVTITYPFVFNTLGGGT